MEEGEGGVPEDIVVRLDRDDTEREAVFLDCVLDVLLVRTRGARRPDSGEYRYNLASHCSRVWVHFAGGGLIVFAANDSAVCVCGGWSRMILFQIG